MIIEYNKNFAEIKEF